MRRNAVILLILSVLLITLPLSYFNDRPAAGIPAGGVTVLIRGGVYELDTAFILNEEDSGEAGGPVIYSAYPGEKVQIVGGKKLDSSGFQPVTDTSPVWNRMDERARGNVLQINLYDYQINDFGQMNPSLGAI